ncbi:MAG: class II aldolase/adducin family protein [Clostridia bacterium]|nr:class II aldolase/adducin family protein [Clostridia bacterium]
MNNYIQTILDYAKRLVAEGVVGESDMISMRFELNEMYITKAGVKLADLTEDDVVKMNIFTADKEYKYHSQIYNARSDINAICQCYPKWVVPVAKAGVTIPAVLDDMAQIVGPTCKTSADDINSIIKTLKGRNSCLVKDKGCITSGRTMDEAYTCVLVLDKASHCFVAGSVIGENKIINGFEARLMRFIYKTKYSKKNQQNLSAMQDGDTKVAPAEVKTSSEGGEASIQKTWSAESEAELRQIIKDSGVGLLEENLVQGTWGNTATRLDNDHMLVTPTGLDYIALTPEDMPVVKISDPSVWAYGKKPTSERKIHAAIMQARPEINATIHSHPIFCSILASARIELPVMNEEMEKLVGGSCRVGAYGLPGTKTLKNGTVEAMQGRNACFMANHGVFCAGKNMDEAFDIIRIMEKSCYQYIQKRTLEATGAQEYSDDLLFDYFVAQKTAKKK